MIQPDEKKAFATFHLLTNPNDEQVLQNLYKDANITQIGQIIPYLEEKNFGGVKDNIHLRTLKQILKWPSVREHAFRDHLI